MDTYLLISDAVMRFSINKELNYLRADKIKYVERDAFHRKWDLHPLEVHQAFVYHKGQPKQDAEFFIIF